MQSVELLLDPATDAAVRAEWAALSAAGLRSQADHRGETNAPHVSLAVADHFPAEGEEALVGAVATVPFPVRLGALVVFGSRRLVLARLVVVDRPILDLHAAVAADGAGELTDTTLVVSSMRGGVSGGTVDSVRTQLAEMKKDGKLRRLAARPYSLSPYRSRETDFGRQLDAQVVNGTQISPSLRGWKAPFFMASYNTRVVRRSNALRDWAYGKQFRYREVMNVGTSFASPVIAGAVSVGLGAALVGMTVLPRKLLDRVLPEPGKGPSTQAQENGHFTMDVYTTTTSGARYRSRVKADGDPGYKATAVMLSESALALVHNRDSLPEAAGVLTPATGIGDALVTRLQDAGLEIWARKE